MRPAICAENLSKRYKIGLREKAVQTFREAIVGLAAAPVRRFRRLGEQAREAETIWALRDVSFSVLPGEVIGIIGRNGAGKTTLLKILSRITAPTTGRVELCGRVASLLEVGTGFHQELTGRENIYLNGAILGMKKHEIDSRFDEIVAFAEVAKFLDTPVKRYSSGMYVRLAFAVAAHLDPDILLVDEVLAVGDAGFQRKCLGKMRDVAAGGRTVLFVSHNMTAIDALCSSALLLERGAVTATGLTSEVIEKYLTTVMQLADVTPRGRRDRRGDGHARVAAIRLNGVEPAQARLATGSRLVLEVDYTAKGDVGHPRFLAGIYDKYARPVLFLDSQASGRLPQFLPASGLVSCVVEELPLQPGLYHINIDIYRGPNLSDQLEFAAQFEVHGSDMFGTGHLPYDGAPVVTRHVWSANDGFCPR